MAWWLWWVVLTWIFDCHVGVFEGFGGGRVCFLTPSRLSSLELKSGAYPHTLLRLPQSFCIWRSKNLTTTVIRRELRERVCP
ncbi:hypothetical protein M758_11G116200 [Ceratodon purpureus]|nr:hypothetical protein M758_11G116200 [Ceratodon purpureus]